MGNYKDDPVWSPVYWCKPDAWGRENRATVYTDKVCVGLLERHPSGWRFDPATGPNSPSVEEDLWSLLPHFQVARAWVMVAKASANVKKRKRK